MVEILFNQLNEIQKNWVFIHQIQQDYVATSLKFDFSRLYFDIYVLLRWNMNWTKRKKVLQEDYLFSRKTEKLNITKCNKPRYSFILLCTYLFVFARSVSFVLLCRYVILLLDIEYWYWYWMGYNDIDFDCSVPLIVFYSKKNL